MQAHINLWIVQIQNEMLQHPQYKQYEVQLNLVKVQFSIFPQELNFYRVDGYESSPKNST